MILTLKNAANDLSVKIIDSFQIPSWIDIQILYFHEFSFQLDYAPLSHTRNLFVTLRVLQPPVSCHFSSIPYLLQASLFFRTEKVQVN